MPAFTFEKIPPSGRHGQIAPLVKKRRGIIIQILDRFVETRIRRSLREEESAASCPAPKASK
jgi:hypothetical protein